MVGSPIKEVEFGTALTISLDNYYDLLKRQVGGLGANELLQLKLAADTVDIDPEPVPEGYRWWSYYNLLRRADVQVQPSPVSDQIMTGAEQLNAVYGDFLARLRTFAIVRDLTTTEQQDVADYSVRITALREEANELAIRDRVKWAEYCELTGTNPGNMSQYIQWSNAFGYYQDIQIKLRDRRRLEALRQRILDRAYSDPDDRRIVEAEFNYINSFQSLRYPIFPDYEYNDGAQFSATYLANLTPGSTGIFDDRRVITVDKSLEELKSGGGGSFTATFDRNTRQSRSITTDWDASSTGSYGFIKVDASASEHTSIQEDFRHGTTMELSAKSVYKANLIYPAWFDPTLFANKRVTENIRDFEDFFAETGSLRYYPVSIVVIRGFAIKFTSSQRWQYDYERKFKASAGGGFNAFGVSFGGRGNYSKHEVTHDVDQQNTTLTISDGDATLRFVGIGVKENTVYEEAVAKEVKKSLPKALFPSDRQANNRKRPTKEELTK